MSISNYSELQTAIGSWLGRTDISSLFPDFIALFEAHANRKLLGTRQMETSTNLTPSAGSVALPSDYLATRRLTWTGTPRRELEYLHPSLLQAYFPSTAASTPTHYTIEASTIKIRPTDGTTLEFDYFQKIPALITNSTNWLLTNYPGFYLFGSLVEANAYVVDMDKAAIWKSRRDEVADEIVMTDNRSDAQLTIRTAGAYP